MARGQQAPRAVMRAERACEKRACVCALSESPSSWHWFVRDDVIVGVGGDLARVKHDGSRVPSRNV
jgi:hypothetical protein